VQGTLYEQPLPHRLVLLDGLTGTGKTDLLHRLDRLGVQVLDLEGLARHRGSLLGAMPGGQPSQKGFETALAARLAALDPARPIVSEAESSKIGNLSLPPSLWAIMQAASRIEVTAEPPARARYLARAYADLFADRERLEPLLQQLIPLRGRATVDHWTQLLAERRYEDLSAALASDHYDPAYRRSRARYPAPSALSVPAGDLTDPDLDRAAEAIATAVAGPGPWSA
jgi:tRNA 2-selenouridine synthase